MASRSAITIDTETAENILKEIETVKKSLDVLRKKIIKFLPSKYGSDVWWEKAEFEADEDIKKGRIFGPFKNANEFLEALHKEANQ